MDVHQFLCRSDNYGVLIRDPATGAVAAIDAPDEAALVAALEEKGWALSDILVTHSHADHIEGIPGLRRRYGCRVTLPRKAALAVAEPDALVAEGDEIMVGSLRARVMETPGHCSDHVVYLFEGNTLFAGDVLFAMGCGRIFGDSPAVMWDSLSRLAALPDETTVYCGHEYTVSNGRFAAHVEPDNRQIAERLAGAEKTRAAGGMTLPTSIGLEKATNPFLRAGGAQRFAELREQKNRF